MKKFTDEGGEKKYKRIMKQGASNGTMAFDDTARIHYFGLSDGSILAAEVTITTVTKITPEDSIEQTTKKVNNSMNLYIGEN